MLHVYILTRCRSLHSLYGSLLVFRTLRTGFPTARVHVFENCSQPEAREQIKAAAQQCHAEFTQLDREVPHHAFIEGMVKRQEAGAAVFVDSDICFWSNVESWRFDALVAGRLIPRFRCEMTRCVVEPRVHTSLLWVPDVRHLRDAISNFRQRELFLEFDPFRPLMLKMSGEWHRLDTGGSLVAAFSDRVRPFSEKELDCYDHLFCGSHPAGGILSRMSGDSAEMFWKMHADVQRDHNTLRGAWRVQEEYFAARQVQEARGRRADAASCLTSIVIPCWNQLEFTRQCIASIKKHTRRPYELIVIDNGSTDGTDVYLAGVQDAGGVPVTVISNSTNRGFPAAINQGLEAARGEYLVMLNNDVVVTDGWLEQLIGLANAKRGFTAEIAEDAEGRTEGKEGAGFIREGKFTTEDAKDAKGEGRIAKKGFTAEIAEHAEGRTEGKECTGFLHEGKFTTKDAKGEERIASVASRPRTSDLTDVGIRADAIVAGLCEAGLGAGLAPRSRASVTTTVDRRLGIGLVGPMSNYAAPPQLVENVPYRDLVAMQEFARRWRDEHRGKWFTTGKLSGFCLLMKRAVYETIGRLDERFGLGFFDDDDFCRRAREAGFELAVAHDLFVHHFGSRTFQGNGVDGEKLLGDNARRFADKWGLKDAGGKRVSLQPWRAASAVASDEGTVQGQVTLSPFAPRKNGLSRSERRHYSHPQSRDPRDASYDSCPDKPAGSGRDAGDPTGATTAVERATVSLTMIVRDEEDNLGRCLESVRGLFDEIVIVDTGSVDRTKEIAREFGAKVFDFVWVDDFAAARNEALAHTTGDYAFWLDADDVVETAEREKLRALLEGLAGPVARSGAGGTAEVMAVGFLDPKRPCMIGDEPPSSQWDGMAFRPTKYRSRLSSQDHATPFRDRSTPPHAVPDASAVECESGLDHASRRRNPGRRDLRSARTQTGPAEWRPAAYVVRCACATGPDGKRGGTVVDHVRLFPIRPGVRWSYRVHEQILPSLKRAKIPVKWTDVVVTHTGYVDEAGESRKLDRNIKILKLELEEKPNDPFVLFNLGMSAVERREWPEALEFLQRSLAGSAPTDSIVRKIFALLARVHQSTGDLQEAVRTCDEGLALDPEDAELWHRKAVAHRHRREPAEAERCWRRILELKRPERFCSFDQGLYGHITRRNLAALAAERGDLAEAEQLYGEVLAEFPGDREAVAKLGQLKSRPAMADGHPAPGLTPRP